MPSKSKKQAKLMAAVAHNPKFAKKVGIPQSVGEDFHQADKKVGKYMHDKPHAHKEHYVGHKDHKHEDGEKLHKSMIGHAQEGHNQGFHKGGGKGQLDEKAADEGSGEGMEDNEC
jgi:hypothetical protein